MLLFRVWTYINIEITCKNSEPNLKNWVRFWDWNLLTLPPRGCRFCPTLGGYLIPPHINEGRIGFRPYVAIYKLDLFKNWAHIPKIGQKFQKLSEISRFENFEKLRFRPTLITEIVITRSVFKKEIPSFECIPIFMCFKNHVL